MGGRCEACGGQVMPYRTYMFWWKTTAECAACGSPVRLRGFWILILAGVVIGGIGMNWVLGYGGEGTFGGLMLILAVLALGFPRRQDSCRMECEGKWSPVLAAESVANRREDRAAAPIRVFLKVGARRGYRR